MEKGEVLDTSILIGGASGLTTIFNIIEYPPASKHCNIIFPNRIDFKRAVDLSWKLRKSGNPIGTIDILISSICINRGLKLISNDADFRAVKEVEPSFDVDFR